MEEACGGPEKAVVARHPARLVLICSKLGERMGCLGLCVVAKHWQSGFFGFGGRGGVPGGKGGHSFCVVRFGPRGKKLPHELLRLLSEVCGGRGHAE